MPPTDLLPLSASQITVVLQRARITKDGKGPGFVSSQQRRTEVRVFHSSLDALQQAHELGRCEEALLHAGYSVDLLIPRDQRIYLKVTKTGR